MSKYKLKNKANSYCTALMLKEFKFQTNLGVTASERAKKQLVALSLKISFPRPPLGCQTGKISDTICYLNLTKSIKKFVEKKEFTLIEKLGMELFVLVKNSIPCHCKLYLSLAKKPPIIGLKKSIFEISD